LVDEVTHKFIIENFWQREKYGNCATVGIIKAAMMKYGCNKIFKRQQQRGDSIIITLRNGKTIHLSEDDIEEYNQDNGMDFEPAPLDAKQFKILETTVRLCFAVMVRYLMEYGFRKEFYTKKEAIKDLLHNGFDTGKVYRFLGLSRSKVRKVKEENFPSVQKKLAIIFYNWEHAVVASRGYYDNDGEAILLTDHKFLRGKNAKWWYQLQN
jgi:hypothetical protein